MTADRSTGNLPATAWTSPKAQPASRAGNEDGGLWRAAVAVLVGTALVRLLMAAAVPLFPDETYYWVWSRHLAPGYFDHPAGIALLIRLGTDFLGASRLGVRVPIVLAGFVSSFAVALTARRLSGDRAALLAATILACMPFAGAGLLLAAPDAPLLLAGSWCLYFVIRALEHPSDSFLGTVWWLAGGIASGLALDSKYTALLIPFSVLVALLLIRRLRSSLAGPGPYAAGALGIVLFLPVVLWNARHDWISFGFQFHHGLGHPDGSAWVHEALLLGGQLGLASPILFVMMMIAAVQVIRRASWGGRLQDGSGGASRRAILAVVTLMVPGVFVVSALFRRVEPNWLSPAYVAAPVVLATYPGGDLWRRWLARGLALGAALVALVYVQALYPLLPLPPPRDPVAGAFGYSTLATEVQESRRLLMSEGARTHVWVAADTYQTASELTFHMEGHPRVFSVNLEGRSNQYDLWPGFAQEARPGDALLLVTGCSSNRRPLDTELARHFREEQTLTKVALLRRGGVVDRRCIRVLRDWDGTWLTSGSSG